MKIFTIHLCILFDKWYKIN